MAKVLALLPGAPGVHILRDPSDVARSNIAMMWTGNVYFGADTWLKTERDGQDHGHHAADRTLAMRYEDLVSDPEGVLTQICAHVDLDFDPVVLGYGATTTYDPPDPSLAQQ
ncbi:sulfotransferase family protein [Rhodobaculum claviforme]|uniref:sulfotransferase family protein n=1 Tax=Rhodobaculum claviforme TaxID=1549854 RepID=UPI00237C460E|nr:sulfotransferase [Rhodobaculum claviforme]